MEKQQKKRAKKYISWILAVALVAALAVLPMLASSEDLSGEYQASVLSDTAQLREITTVIKGGGTLTSQDAVTVTIPSAVKLTEYLVANGETVTAGQEIAAVDRVTVMTAITQVQETMEALQEQIDDCSDEEAADEIITQAEGIVKIVYAEAGDDVQEVMLEHGALAVLSLDGLMAVEIQRNTDLSGGDAVCVVLSDGTEAEGQVVSNKEGVLVVTVEDDGYAIGEKVTVKTEDGDRIGTGSLYIHSQWNAVGYSGTVTKVAVSENESVDADDTLFYLEDTGHTAQFDSLTRQHREYEALMLELFRMYQSERILSPGDGMVTGVDESGAYMLSSSGNGFTVSLLANSPNGDDESTYINYIGQVTELALDGLIVNVNPQQLAITDYMDLSGVPTDPALMTESVTYNAQAPVYELVEGVWIQIQMSDLSAGDVLLFAGDSEGNFVWLVRVEKAAAETPAPTDPTTPTEPTDPSEPTTPTEPGETETPVEDPTTPTDNTTSSMPSQSGGGMTQGSISFPSASSGMTAEETEELYSLDTVTIASVTPQETLTLQISVDELDISKVYLGQSAEVTVNALSGEKFTAAVTYISASGENEGGNSKFTVELTLDKEADMLSGMNASVTISLETEGPVVTVPVAALIETGTQTQVYTGYDEETGEYSDPVAVTVGVSDGEYAQILSGLSAGQTLYYPYYDTLVISNVPDVSSGFSFR